MKKKVLIVFSLAASAWMFRTLLDNFVPFAGLTDAGIAIFAALSFFLIPSENNKTDLLTWEQANKLPWGLLVLFGGGLSLAASIGASGLGSWIGQGLNYSRKCPAHCADTSSCNFDYILNRDYL
jgi:sodium-dependent dicarboxylate transporter 2/3/5